MNKTDIQTILQNPYERNVWIEFLRPTFGGSYRSNAPTIALPNNEIADFAYEIGQFTTTDNMLVGVYEVKIKEGISIENKRVGLRNLLKSVYRVVDAALIVFDTGEAWRFSYVSEIYARDEAGNRQHLKTDPKRFTYVLGKGGGVRTATDRFVELSKKSLQIKLKDLNDVFSVEILTKHFYRDLSDWYFWALTNVQFPDDAEPNEEIRNATSVIRLITRLMFVWFLKQKHLVRDELFEEETLRKMLKNFNPKGSEESSVFYKAILQNLFFATLNTEMTDDKRKFISRQTGVQGFYRYERYFQNKELFLELSKETPFLNGGLFENLDRNIGEVNEIRIDCFSNRISNENRLIVPDSLFFGEETVDLSGIYDDKKRKPSNVKGLINILKSYNFTVEENTPTDIEVALDPELLGKVFENLLASYNPETKTTARKQTGSFYTPREIVEYMVDESLKAYLIENLVENRNKGFQKLGTNQAHLFGNAGVKGQLDLVTPMADSTQESIKESLENLFSYANEDNPFDKDETQTLIRAIDKCRILDPACGSGAFPMGILQRLVFLLRKLDPQNSYWRERQIKRATKDFETALRAGQTIDLQAQIQEITETFTNNTDDYGRKLYLIENCIYGVDIQPIAVQIAKLRFFISLMAEQNPLQQGANRGIRPLPNLETKFVAGNTLIGLEKPTQLLLKNTAIDILEKQLEEVRHKHFFARTPETKKKYRLKDQELRNEIAKLLSEDGWKPTSANQVAAWNPYDQNTYAPFFDPEWMFGIIDGFDIVIGNPPYVRADNPAIAEQRERITKSKYYDTLWEKWDLMVPFYEKSIKLLTKNGINAFISSNSITTSKYAQKLQEWILKSYSVKSINYFEDNMQIFEAGVVPVVTIIQNKKGNSTQKIYRQAQFDYIHKLLEIDWKETNNLREKVFKKEFLTSYTPTIKFDLLGDICYLSKGMVIHSEGTVEDEIFGKDDLISNTQNEINCMPYIEGKILKRYYVEKIKYLEWNTDRVPSQLSRPTFPALYQGEKLFRGALTDGTFDDTGILCNHSIVVFKLFVDLKGVMERSIGVSISKNNFEETGGKSSAMVARKRKELEETSKKYSLKYILGVLNSVYAKSYLNNFRRHRLINYFYPDDFRNYPIPQISLEAQQPFIQLVDYILQLKKQGLGEAALMAKYFEEIVDGLVYELYFEEELHRADIYFHKHLQDLPTINDNNIATVFGELYSPQHPVRAGLFKLDTVEEVAIIEGKKK